MKDSILRVIDDLETRLENIENQLKDPYIETYSLGELYGRKTMTYYAIQELKKVVDDHGRG